MRNYEGDINTNWRTEAACGYDPNPDDWFPDTRNHTLSERALTICATCPVRAECYQAGQNYEYGIWGGVLAGQRKKHISTQPPGWQ